MLANNVKYYAYKVARQPRNNNKFQEISWPFSRKIWCSNWSNSHDCQFLGEEMCKTIESIKDTVNTRDGIHWFPMESIFSRRIMANRRMISKTLGGSKKLRSLQENFKNLSEFCSLIYCLGIPHHDDLGQISADPHDWKYNIFPVSERSIDDFREALKCLEMEGLFQLSKCGKVYKYVNFEKFQTLKSDRNPQNDYPGIQWNPMESNGIQWNLNLSKDKLREDNKDSCSELQNNSKPQLTIPLIKRDGEFLIYQIDIKEWQDTFPAVNVLQELKEIRLWNINNPKRRKTKDGIRQHIANWLEKEQNKGRGYENDKPRGKHPSGCTKQARPEFG